LPPRQQFGAALDLFPAIGRHTATWLEYGATTITYFGDNGEVEIQSGISGFIEG